MSKKAVINTPVEQLRAVAAQLTSKPETSQTTIKDDQARLLEDMRSLIQQAEEALTKITAIQSQYDSLILPLLRADGDWGNASAGRSNSKFYHLDTALSRYVGVAKIKQQLGTVEAEVRKLCMLPASQRIAAQKQLRAYVDGWLEVPETLTSIIIPDVLYRAQAVAELLGYEPTGQGSDTVKWQPSTAFRVTNNQPTHSVS